MWWHSTIRDYQWITGRGLSCPCKGVKQKREISVSCTPSSYRDGVHRKSQNLVHQSYKEKEFGTNPQASMVVEKDSATEAIGGVATIVVV